MQIMVVRELLLMWSWAKHTMLMAFVNRQILCMNFNGCVYHGCPLCFDGANDRPFHSERKMCVVYEATIECEKRLQALRFTGKSIWEHDYQTLRETDEMKLFLDTFDTVTDLDDLDPCDSFFGGRVSGFS